LYLWIFPLNYNTASGFIELQFFCESLYTVHCFGIFDVDVL